MRISLSLFLVTLLSACSIQSMPRWLSPHVLDVQQGNVVTQDQVSQLQVGMNMQQVRRILGSPLMSDMFHAHRWDYKYQYYRQHRLVSDALLTLHFEKDRLTHIEGVAQTERQVAPTAHHTPAAPVAVPHTR